MRFLAACVVGNTARSKLGHNLAQNSMKSQLDLISSDSFCLNAMYVLHDLCTPFLNLNDPKEMWKKVDPTYLPSGVRIDITDETPICSGKEWKQALKFPKEYGTISEFYFMELQMIHVGLMHTVRKYADVRKMIEKLQEEKKDVADEQVLAKYEHELQKLKPFRIAYELVLCDPNLAKVLEKFFIVHMQLMKDWGQYDAKTCRFQSKANLFCYLPENFFIDFIDSISELLKLSSRGFKIYMSDSIVGFYEFCIALLRTDS